MLKIKEIEVGDKFKTKDGSTVTLTNYLFGFSNGEDESFYIFDKSVRGNSNFIQGLNNLSRYLVEKI